MERETGVLFNYRILRRIYFAYLLLILASQILGFFNMQGGSDFERGAALFFPMDKGAYGREMSISGMAYARSGVGRLEFVLAGEGGETAFPLERQTVERKGEEPLQLSSFQTVVSVPRVGDYRAFLRVYCGGGEVFDGQARRVTILESGAPEAFRQFSAGHMLAMALTVAFFLALIIYARVKNTERARQAGKAVIAGCTMALQVSIMYYLAFEQSFRISYDIMFHLCSMALLLLPWFLFARDSKTRDNLYQIMFLWGLGGAIQGVLTPNLDTFPYFGLYHVCYFGTHAMIISAVIYMTYACGCRPKLKKLPMVLGVTAAAAVAMYLVNIAVSYLPPYELGSYFFISYPPATAGGENLIQTMERVFGPSPRYAVGLLLLAVALDLGLMVPVKLGDLAARLIRRDGKREKNAVGM